MGLMSRRLFKKTHEVFFWLPSYQKKYFKGKRGDHEYYKKK